MYGTTVKEQNGHQFYCRYTHAHTHRKQEVVSSRPCSQTLFPAPGPFLSDFLVRERPHLEKPHRSFKSHQHLFFVVKHRPLQQTLFMVAVMRRLVVSTSERRLTASSRGAITRSAFSTTRPLLCFLLPGARRSPRTRVISVKGPQTPCTRICTTSKAGTTGSVALEKISHCMQDPD